MPQSIIDNTIVSYEIYGKGRPMVFVHGWGGSSNSLRKLATICSQKRKVIVVDLPGFGKSDPPDPDWGPIEYAEVIHQLIKELKLNKPVFFGHSFGGSLGIYLASNYPDLLQRLILCGSAYKRTGKQSGWAVKLNRIVETYLPFLMNLVDSLKPTLYRIFFPDSDYAKYPKLIPNFRRIITHDMSHLLEGVTIPTLILWGERDTYTPVAMAHELDERIPNTEIVLFPHKRHNLPIRYADQVAPEIFRFLGKRM